MAYRKENCLYMGCPLRRHNRRGEPTCLYRAERTWCHSSEHKDRWMFDLYDSLLGAKALQAHDSDPAASECPHCGRTWSGPSDMMLRLDRTLNRHVQICRTRTPIERYRSSRKSAGKRHRRKPTAMKVVDDHDHPGMQVPGM